MVQTVLILGGGIGGLVAANTSGSAAEGASRRHDGTGGVLRLRPSFLWLMTGGRTAEEHFAAHPATHEKGIEV